MAGKFQEAACAHLTRYRETVMGIAERGTYTHRSVTRSYGHILPQTLYRQNILPAHRDSFWSWHARHGQGCKLHQGFHHLNSSQALCFNLFFPLMQDASGMTAVLRAIGVDAAPIGAPVFEFIPDAEENTNFDFMVPLAGGGRVTFEVKYTEEDFASARQDERHIQKFHATYAARCAERFTPEYCGLAPFLENYQIMRNIWHMRPEHNDVAVFLFPRANPGVYRRRLVPHACALQPLRDRILVIYLEDVLKALQTSPALAPATQNSLQQFADKYFPQRK